MSGALTSRLVKSPSSKARAGRCPLPADYKTAEGARKKCSKAEKQEVQRPAGAFVCQECGRDLKPVKAGGRSRLIVPAAAAVVLLALLGVGGYYWISQPPQPALACTSRTPGGNDARIRALIDRNPPTAELMAAASDCADVNLLDTVVLLRAASDRDDATAALSLGQIYDPIDVDGRKRQISPPFPRNAATFYLKARQGNNPDACGRLTPLLAWAREQALAGNADARQVQAVLEGARAC